MTVPALLGIDGGGTSTVAWLADAGGSVLGRGRSGPSNVKAVGADAARDALGRSIASAFADAGRSPGRVEVACLGLAGFDRPEDRRLLGNWAAELSWARRLVLVNDGDLVVAAGTRDGWGVGLIAGTGSIAVGRSPDGRAARAGGWGYLLGDEGSAYAVALAALRVVVRRVDGRDAPTSGRDALTDRLCRALGIAGPSELVSAIYAPGVDRSKLAGLAPSVIAAAEDDPWVAEALLRPAGRELAELVVAVVRSLGLREAMAGGPLPLAMAGGFLLSTPDVARSVLEALDRAGLPAEATPVADPVGGALVLARKALDGP